MKLYCPRCLAEMRHANSHIGRKTVYGCPNGCWTGIYFAEESLLTEDDMRYEKNLRLANRR